MLGLDWKSANWSELRSSDQLALKISKDEQNKTNEQKTQERKREKTKHKIGNKTEQIKTLNKNKNKTKKKQTNKQTNKQNQWGPGRRHKIFFVQTIVSLKLLVHDKRVVAGRVELTLA